jgi:hypothetical protein
MATDTMPRTPGGNRQQARQAARPGGARGVSSPRHTRPITPPPVPPSRAQRMPFILLLVGLLGGALVSLLVISTTLDEGSYRINTLTQDNNELAKEEQILNAQVQDEQAMPTIEQEAWQLGMRPDKNLRFIDVKTGTISSSSAVAP